MDLETLERLKVNPFYKMSAEQEAEYARLHKKPMIEFGNVELHNNTVTKHEPEPVRTNRTGKEGK